MRNPQDILGCDVRRLLILLLAAMALAEEPRPIAMRDKPPADAKQFLRWTAELDGIEDLHIRGRTLERKHRKLGRPKDVEHHFFAALPKRELRIFVRLVKGRGRALVLQDPSRVNGYEAIVRVYDKGRGSAPAVLEIHFGKRPPPPAPFPVPIPESKATEWNRHALQTGRFFGERAGPVRQLAKGKPLFKWSGKVDGYAVLAVGDNGLELLDGDRSVRSPCSEKLGNRYVVLSRCDGPGRVRVVQRMRTPGERRALIEIDDRAVAGASSCAIVAHAVPAPAVDAIHGEGNGWLERALTAKDEASRLWAIEKVCMLREYPARALNMREAASLAGLARQEKIEPLRGHNVILAWPPDYLKRLPARWRFLAVGSAKRPDELSNFSGLPKSRCEFTRSGSDPGCADARDSLASA